MFVKFKNHVNKEKCSMTQLMVGDQEISLSERELKQLVNNLFEVRPDLLKDYLNNNFSLEEIAAFGDYDWEESDDDDDDDYDW